MTPTRLRLLLAAFDFPITRDQSPFDSFDWLLKENLLVLVAGTEKQYVASAFGKVVIQRAVKAANGQVSEHEDR